MKYLQGVITKSGWIRGPGGEFLSVELSRVMASREFRFRAELENLFWFNNNKAP